MRSGVTCPVPVGVGVGVGMGIGGVPGAALGPTLKSSSRLFSVSHEGREARRPGMSDGVEVPLVCGEAVDEVRMGVDIVWLGRGREGGGVGLSGRVEWDCEEQ